MARRRLQVAGVALGLLAGLAGGLLGYRSHALRKEAAAQATGLGPRSPSVNEAPPRGEPPAGTAAEREAELVSRLAAAGPGSPAAREEELLRRLDRGLLPAATQPLLQARPVASIGPEGLARAETITHGREAEEAQRAREAAWPAIEEAEPPPGPLLPVARPPPPRPRPPRLELPARLDQWGE